MNRKQAERAMDNCPCDPEEWIGRVQVGDPATGPGMSAHICGLRSHREAAETYARLAYPDLDVVFIPRVMPS